MFSVRIPGAKYYSLISIYTQPGGISETIQDGKGLDDDLDIMGFESEIISCSSDLQFPDSREFVVKYVITEDKQEGREGAPLLDTSFYTYLDTGGNRGGDHNVGQEVVDGVGKPRRETLFY